MKLLGSLRSLAFYVGYALFTLVWGTFSILVAWALPFRWRFALIISVWTRFVLLWLRATCGISHKIKGLENIPSEPCVVLAKHESTWETVFLQTIFAPQATVLKRELLNIPFFGWALRLLRPISIDRSQRLGALRQLIQRGKERLNDRIWVVLLPEGSRQEAGKPARFHRGGAALAHSAGVPVLVVAHDAGQYWPAHEIQKRPGQIQVSISPPILPNDRSVSELNKAAEAWLNEEVARLTEARARAAAA